MPSPFDRHFQVRSGNINLSVHTCGNPENPALILVHGYPDNHAVWNRVAEQLQDRFHVVAYDVRGCGASEAPRRIRDYALPLLSRDLVAVMDAVSPDRPVHLAAHDWGSIQTWESVTEPALQDRIATYTSLSGPCLDHVGMLMRHLVMNPTPENVAKLAGQAAHSWYIYLFQLPVVAPTLWKTVLGKKWDELLVKLEGIQSTPAANPTQTRDGVNGINLYRANMMQRLANPRERHSRVPVQLVVAKGDNFVTPQVLERQEIWAPDLTRVEVEGGHWQLLLDHPDVLAETIAGFIQARS